jgi:hypothetical protein
MQGTPQKQPVEGCKVRMGREPKKRMDGKRWKFTTKLEGKN